MITSTMTRDEVLELVSVISNKISSWEEYIELIRHVQTAEMASLRMFQKWKILDHIPGEAGWDEQAVVDCECGRQLWILSHVVVNLQVRATWIAIYKKSTSGDRGIPKFE